MLDYSIRGVSPLPYHLGIMVGLAEEGHLATKIGSDAKNILRAKKNRNKESDAKLPLLKQNI
jgi:hypothetical protein